MTETTLMAVSNGWLDNSAQMTTTGGATSSNVTVGSTYIYPTYYPWQPYYYQVYSASSARPIKLTMSEVERLRKAAKTDEKLKSILQKFTAQIEITVDFE